MLGALALAASLGCTGCFYDDSALNAISCSATRPCTPGHFCVDGLCHPDLDAVIDVALDDGAADDAASDEVEELCGDHVCEATEACCADACVNLLVNAQHCGSCGAACDGTQVCSAGQCVCRAGLSDCDDTPGCEADLLNDSANCSGCSNGCEGLTCADGLCTCAGVVCLGAQECCTTASGLGCVDPQQNRQHCGGCGISCESGERCVDGACGCGAGARCAAGQLCCEDVCIDPTTENTCVCGAAQALCLTSQACCDNVCIEVFDDKANCGTCNEACPADQICAGGTCVCAGGTAWCESACVDLLKDEANCGACGSTCQGGTRCCGGQCVDTQSDLVYCGGCLSEGGQSCSGGTELCCAGTCTSVVDNVQNCGACGVTCASGTCSGTSCPCPAGQTACNGVCVAALSANVSHCGACGNDCAAHASVIAGDTTCAAGACVYACAADFADCESAVPGCETDTRTSTTHCGQCGNACASCVDGACTCAAGEANCGSGCVSVQDDVANCGACGVVCPSGSVCDAGQCKCQSAGGELCPPTGARHASAWCAGADCTLECDADWDDCDGDTATSCEVSLAAKTFCGPSCGTAVDCAGGSSTYCDTAADPTACRCSGSCDPGEHCVWSTGSYRCRCGSTGSSCSSGEWCCDSAGVRGCIDVDTDEFNCGGCGLECAAGTTCVSGRCECGGVECPASGPHQTGALCTAGRCDLTCESGWEDCDGDPTNGCETQHATCGAGQICCNAGGTPACVSAESDTQNCGGCGIACPSGAVCDAGVCLCGGLACYSTGALHTAAACVADVCEFVCSGSYLDCDGDPTNSCEVNCPATGTQHTASACFGGVCELQCNAGRGNCDGDASDSCETNLVNDGWCGATCDMRLDCGESSSDDCNAGPPVFCSCDGGAQCRPGEQCSDTEGADYCVCGSGDACTGSDWCCPTGDGPACTDVSSDDSNCGACGRQCPSGQTCTGGACG